MDLVSIVIPVYNGEQYIRQALDSALAQTYKNIEIIVVNDASTDKTEDIVKQYSVKYLKHETNKGLSAAMNTGLAHSKGQYLMELDCDDYIDKELVELSLQWFEAKKTDIVGVWQKEFGDRGEIHYFHPNPTHKDFLNGNKINCSSMYKRKVYEAMLKEYGFMYDEKLKVYQDWQAWIRATKLGFTVATIPLPLFHYRIHKGSLITDMLASNTRHDAFEVMKDSLPDIFK